MATVATNLNVGDRVYYLDIGEEEAGTVVDIATKSLPPYVDKGDVAVQFDNDGPDDIDWYLPTQLGKL